MKNHPTLHLNIILSSFHYSENGKRPSPGASPDDVAIAWSDKAGSSKGTRERGDSSEAVFCVVGKNEGGSPDVKMKKSASRERTIELPSSNDPETRSLGTGEVETEPLRKPKYPSAPDMQKFEPTSPGELRGAGLLSCFPSFKTGANKSKQYKLVVRSPNGSAEDSANLGRKLSRYFLKFFSDFYFPPQFLRLALVCKKKHL